MNILKLILYKLRLVFQIMELILKKFLIYNYFKLIVRFMYEGDRIKAIILFTSKNL